MDIAEWQEAVEIRVTGRLFSCTPEHARLANTIVNKQFSGIY
jgi:hypothetical protein